MTARRPLSALLGPRTLLIGGVLIAAWGAFAGSIGDPDFWWHLAVGRWMVEHGQLPAHDLFTYTVPTHVWTDHEYLTEILMWLAYSHGGVSLISIGFGLVTWAGLVVIYLSAGGPRTPYVIAGAGLALGVLAGGPIWGPRSQMITFLFSAVELWWLRGYLAGRSRAILGFPLLMALWANLHGGWAIGFAFLGVALVAEALEWLLHRGEAEAAAHLAHLRRLAVITAVSVLAVLATPHGPSLYLYPFETQGSVAQQHLIVEWFSPDFHLTSMLPFEAMVFVTILGFALRRPSLYDLLLTLSVLALALHSVRHIALFVAAVTPVLIIQWSAIWRDRKVLRRWPESTAHVRPALAAATVLVLLVIAGATGVKMASGILEQGKQDASDYPVAAADWIAAHPDQVGTRMYNQYGWGGYLVWRFYPDPDRKVFIFGEAALMGDDLLNRYQDVQTLRSDWTQVLDRYGVDTVIYNRGEALSNVLAGREWRLVYEDRVAVVYVRGTR